MTIGERLWAIRNKPENLERWPSALRLSLAAGLGKNSVANIERGGVPTIETVRALANTLGVPITDLIGEDNDDQVNSQVST